MNQAEKSPSIAEALAIALGEEGAAGMAIFGSIFQTQQAMASRLEDLLRPLGLSYARYTVLAYLAYASRRGTSPLGKISEALGVHAASITKATDRLAEDGFISKEAHPTSGRTVLARITPAGRAQTRKATEHLRQLFRAFSLETEEIDQFVRTCDLIRAAAEGI